MHVLLLLLACAPKAPPPAPAPPPVAELPPPAPVEEVAAAPPPPPPPPKPFLTEALVEGWLERDVVLSVVNRALPQIQGCYQAGLRDRPGLAGQMEIKFNIGQGGGVTYVDIARSTLDNPEVEVCVARIFGLLRFPAPRSSGVAVVRYPLVFSAEQGSAP